MAIISNKKKGTLTEGVEWCPLSKKVFFTGAWNHIPSSRSEETPHFNFTMDHVNRWLKIAGLPLPVEIVPHAHWYKTMEAVVFLDNLEHIPEMFAHSRPGKRAVNGHIRRHDERQQTSSLPRVHEGNVSGQA